MVDIHCHLLPLVDDGPSSIEQTLHLARQATEEGIRHVIATPHLFHPEFKSTQTEVGLIVAELNVLLKQRDIPLTVYPGHEVRLHEDLMLEIENGLIQTLANSRYLLLDLPDDIPHETSDWIDTLIREGYHPIIAHVEKNRTLREQPDRLVEWIRAGALSHVSCASITGVYGKEVRQFALSLLKNGLAQLVASNAHNATRRPFLWESCHQHLIQELDEGLVKDLYHNAECVLLDRPLVTMPLQSMKKNWKGQWV